MGTQGSCSKPACMSTLPFLRPLLKTTANFCTGEDQSVQRATLSPTSCSGQACFGEGERQTNGSPGVVLVLGQATYGSASATSCSRAWQAQMGPMGLHCGASVPQRGVIVPQRGVSEEVLDVQSLQIEAVKHLDYGNLRY